MFTLFAGTYFGLFSHIAGGCSQTSETFSCFISINLSKNESPMKKETLNCLGKRIVFNKLLTCNTFNEPTYIFFYTTVQFVTFFVW